MGRTEQPMPISRRERLKREREMRILEAAAAVFARKGSQRSTIREIAVLADVAVGTIYNYYANKEALLVAMTRHIIAESASNTLAQFREEDDRSFLRALLSDRFALVEQKPDFFRAMLTEMCTNETFRKKYMGEVIAPLAEVMACYLQARIEAGTIRPLNKGIIIRAMAGSIMIFVLLSQPGYRGLQLGVSTEELVDELVDFFLLGLQAEA
jgi:AcrR family transcriptional regulator